MRARRTACASGTSICASAILPPRRQFYCDTIGLDPTAGRGGALFMSSGRYHHHVGSNVWQSAGAGTRDDDRAGLSWFAFEAADAAQRDAAIAAAEGRERAAERGRKRPRNARSVRNQGPIHRLTHDREAGTSCHNGGQ